MPRYRVFADVNAGYLVDAADPEEARYKVDTLDAGPADVTTGVGGVTSWYEVDANGDPVPVSEDPPA